MPIFESFDDENVNQLNPKSTVKTYDFTEKKSKGAFLTRVFGVMFICLLITTAVAAGFGYGFQHYLVSTATIIEGEVVFSETALTTLFTILGISCIALLVMSFVLPITFARGKRNILIPLIIYVVLMGVMLSTFTFVFEWYLLVEAFGVTTLAFGVMALLGYVSKGRLTGIGAILSSLLIGALLLSGINFIIFLFGGMSEGTLMLSLGVSLMIFAFLMLVTMYDVWRIKQIAESGAGHNNNLVLYCAYILYSDFIAILIRVIYYLAIIRRRN